jgi:Tfp pilus assembly protein PilF
MCNLASLLVAQGEGGQLLGAEALLKDAVEIDPKSFIANSLLAQVFTSHSNHHLSPCAQNQVMWTPTGQRRD